MDLVPSVIYEATTDLDTYQVVERIYTNRPARLLYGTKTYSAQSGLPLDELPTMLFGYNQRFVELVEFLNPKSVLLIGGGVYTLPSYLSATYPDMQFDIVEPDTGLGGIARRYFNYHPSDSKNIIHTSGLDFIKSTKKTYDLIIVDAFLGYDIPSEILTRKFVKSASGALKPGGVLAANVISSLEPNSVMSDMHKTYSSHFKYQQVFPADGDTSYLSPTNLVYVLSDNQIEFKLKHPAIDLAGLGG